MKYTWRPLRESVSCACLSGEKSFPARLLRAALPILAGSSPQRPSDAASPETKGRGARLCRPRFRFAPARPSQTRDCHAVCDRLRRPRKRPPLLPSVALRAAQTVTLQVLRTMPAAAGDSMAPRDCPMRQTRIMALLDGHQKRLRKLVPLPLLFFAVSISFRVKMFVAPARTYVAPRRLFLAPRGFHACGRRLVKGIQRFPDIVLTALSSRASVAGLSGAPPSEPPCDKPPHSLRHLVSIVLQKPRAFFANAQNSRHGDIVA